MSGRSGDRGNIKRVKRLALSDWSRPSWHVDQGEDYGISIVNKEGLVIEELDDVSLSASGFRKPLERMQDLYRRARRRAMGVERALDEILSSLGPELELEAPNEPVGPAAENLNQGVADDDVRSSRPLRERAETAAAAARVV